jgi:flagellar biosynthetic protein FliQ
MEGLADGIRGCSHRCRAGCFKSAARRTLKEGCAVMSLDQATDLVRQTLIMALIISSPMLCIGLVVGVCVSLLQAVTQIQEQTLTFIPKIVAMVASTILLMPWIGHRLMEYTATMFAQ